MPLFNGKDLRGWWESCDNSHAAQDRVNGGIWFADPAQGILFAGQNANGAGSLLATNKAYGNYELVFGIWPAFGNDAGVFNRVAGDGTAWQTGLDYVEGSGIGGSYSENRWSPVSINDDPFRFGPSPENPAVTTWTDFTSTQDPASFGCSPQGCTSADFPAVWDLGGWNELRVKFYGGLDAGSPVTMETWIRKARDPPAPWVPVYKSSRSVVTPAGPIAFQIHGGTAKWKAGAYNLYRGIRIRELRDDGSPAVATGVRRTGAAAPAGAVGMALAGDRLVGRAATALVVAVRDVRGAELARFRAGPGRFEEALPRGARGLILVDYAGGGASGSLRLFSLR